MKRPVSILLIIVGAILIGVIVLVANVSRSRSTVRGIEVVIKRGGVAPIVSEQTVCDSILAGVQGLLQSSVAQLDRNAVAEAAARVPYLKDISVSTSVSGKVVVRATQRRPIARLYYGGREYYFDAHQAVMPAVASDGLNLLVAGADYTAPLNLDTLSIALADLWQVASFLDRQKKYGDLIDQVYAEADGDLMMVPKLGNHVVELGTVEDLDTKFEGLLAFYRRGMPRAGWNTYSRVSLKYKGQVVCQKRH